MSKINVTPGITINYDTNDIISMGSVTSSYITGMSIDITREALAELQDDSKLLYALIDSGVEDWEGYKEAIALWRDRQ